MSKRFLGFVGVIFFTVCVVCCLIFFVWHHAGMSVNKRIRVLAIIDAQRDFIDGALGVGIEKWNPAKEEIINLIKYGDYDAIILTKDWHPENHSSFKDFGGLWPSHCVQNTIGADIDGDILSAIKNFRNVLYIEKGTFVSTEEYGVDLLRTKVKNILDRDVAEIDITGLCFDYCVSACAKMTKEVHPDIKVVIKKSGTVSINNTEVPDVGKAVVE